jgi:hypothetical protein
MSADRKIHPQAAPSDLVPMLCVGTRTYQGFFQSAEVMRYLLSTLLYQGSDGNANAFETEHSEF